MLGSLLADARSSSRACAGRGSATPRRSSSPPLLSLAPAVLSLRRGLARRLPRRRAHRDRELRARRAARAGARALRHAPRRAAARHGRGRQRARGPRAAARTARLPALGGDRRRGRGLDRDLLAGCSATPSAGSPARSRSRATSSSTGSRPPSRRRSSSRSPRRRCAACLELERARLELTVAQAPCREPRRDAVAAAGQLASGPGRSR